MAHGGIGSMLKGPKCAGRAGMLGCSEVCPPQPECIPSFLITPSTGVQPCSPFRTQTGHPLPWPPTHTPVAPLKSLTTRQGPGQSHDEVSKVVGMADHTPPPGHQQPSPCGCRDGLKVWRKTHSGMGGPLEIQLPHLTHGTQETQLTSHSGIRRILSEGVFLRIGSTEDVVTNSWGKA